MIYEDALKFPKNEIAKIITGQIIRSISSIGANIAEGSGRGGKKEFIRYLIIARGSLTESQNWILRIYKFSWINKKRFEKYMDNLAQERRMINALIGKMRKSS